MDVMVDIHVVQNCAAHSFTFLARLLATAGAVFVGLSVTACLVAGTTAVLAAV